VPAVVPAGLEKNVPRFGFLPHAQARSVRVNNYTGTGGKVTAFSSAITAIRSMSDMSETQVPGLRGQWHIEEARPKAARLAPP